MASISDIFTAIQNAVVAVNKVSTTLTTVLPFSTVVSSVAPSSGSITFTSSRAAVFMTVISSSGGSYKLPLYTP